MRLGSRSFPALLAAALMLGVIPAASAQGGDQAPAVAPVPPGFHWGVATSGFQSEGFAPDSNWRRYVDGHANSIKQPYGNSVDFLHRYPEDIALAKRMGVTTFRFSVEWARIMPEPGVIDQNALAFYDDVVRRVKAAGMTPMITLSHFVHPGWISDLGGWTSEWTSDAFLYFSYVVVQRYAGKGVMWITFNEPTAYLDWEMRNGGVNPLQANAMMDNMAAAHRRVYDGIHRLDPGAKVSSNIAYKPPPLQQPDDLLFLRKIGDTLDFVGLDYYYGASLDNPSAIHAFNDELWKIDPQPDGIYYALKEYQRQFPNLPVYVVENGWPMDDGRPRQDGYTRSDHLRDHVYWMQRAMAEGVRVIGYNYWSLTDNYEWGSYQPRFGLYTVDVRTDPALTRRPTDGVGAYQDVISHHGVPAGYTPKRKPAWCAFADPSTCLRPPL